MTPRQLELARHALGLPNRTRRSYRNRFLSGGECPDWRAMEAAGHAESSKPGEHGRTWFWLTTAGALAALGKGERLCPEDFPRAEVRKARKAQAHPPASGIAAPEGSEPKGLTEGKSPALEEGTPTPSPRPQSPTAEET